MKIYDIPVVKTKKEEAYAMICPKCKSTDVEMDRSNPVQPAMGLPPVYLCNKCGHSGAVFPEVAISELDKFEKEAAKEGLTNARADKTPKVDVRYGAFEVKIIWKILGPIFLLLGILLLFREPISGTILVLISLAMIYITYFKKI